MIHIKDLFFSYGENTVFSGLSLELPDGVVCLEGPSGCGKTTLLRLIAGLEIPASGAITGTPDRISFLFQEDRLLPWCTAEDNVAAVLPRERRREAADYLRAVELGDEIDKLPDNLSGGQRRRVALARTLAFGGQLLILDEPFKGLDLALTARLVPVIMAAGVPILAVTHSRDESTLLGGIVIKLSAPSI